MKKITRLLTVFIIAAGLNISAQAIPMYYTFEGSITTISHDNAGAIANAGFNEGDSVSYTLIVDLDADATETHFGGYVDYDSYTDSSSWDYFYVDYYSGDALQQIDGGFYNTVGPADGSGLMSASESNWGYSTLIGQPGSTLHVNSDDDLLQIKNTGLNLTDWTIGTWVHAGNWAFDSENNQSHLFADVMLTNISLVNNYIAVPEPATIFLFILGLAGLALRSVKAKIK